MVILSPQPSTDLEYNRNIYDVVLLRHVYARLCTGRGFRSQSVSYYFPLSHPTHRLTTHYEKGNSVVQLALAQGRVLFFAPTLVFRHLISSLFITVA